MKIEIDTEKDIPEAIREIAHFLLAHIGDPVSTPPLLPPAAVPGGAPLPPGVIAGEPPPLPPLPATTAETVPIGDLDVNRMPWDARIHASTKTKTKDGAWKYARGLADDVKQAVEAEIKGASAPDASVTTNARGDIAVDGPTVPKSVTPSQIISRVSELRATGKMDDAKLAEICAKCGIENVTFVMGLTPELCVKFNDLLDDGVL